MRLLRFGPPGREKPGIMDAEGRLRDLSGQFEDVNEQLLAPGALSRLAAMDIPTLPVVEGQPRLGCPGRGHAPIYRDRAELCRSRGRNRTCRFRRNRSCSPRRSAAYRGRTTMCASPGGSTKMDWEVELGIVIGSRAPLCRRRTTALDHVAGYVLLRRRVGARLPARARRTWDKGKGCETFGPVGPWLVTKDEIGDVQSLDMWLDVNGERMQTGITRTMIFDSRILVSYVSQFMRLLPGDIITTGTPPGVGMGRKPPQSSSGKATSSSSASRSSARSGIKWSAGIMGADRPPRSGVRRRVSTANEKDQFRWLSAHPIPAWRASASSSPAGASGIGAGLVEAFVGAGRARRVRRHRRCGRAALVERLAAAPASRRSICAAT